MGTGVTFPIWSPGSDSADDQARPNPLVVEIDGIYVKSCSVNALSSNALQRLDYYRKRTVHCHFTALVSNDCASLVLAELEAQSRVLNISGQAFVH